VARRLLSTEKARGEYGVVLAGAGLTVDRRASQDLREGMRRNRKPLPLFDFGERRSNRLN